MANGEHSNGSAHVEATKAGTVELHISYDLLTTKATLNGDAPSLDCVLNILDQVRRSVDDQRRMAVARELQAQAIAAQQEAHIRANLRKGT